MQGGLLASQTRSVAAGFGDGGGDVKLWGLVWPSMAKVELGYMRGRLAIFIRGGGSTVRLGLFWASAELFGMARRRTRQSLSARERAMAVVSERTRAGHSAVRGRVVVAWRAQVPGISGLQRAVERR